METMYQITRPNVTTLSDAMAALEQAATAHATHLRLDFPRMLQDFSVLWMIVRSRLCLTRMPKNELTVKTWMRKPSSVVSYRDFALFDGDEEIGYGVQSWVLCDAKERSLINMKKVEPLWTSPTLQPERKISLKRLNQPSLPTVGRWDITQDEIDVNGHLNNVQYVRFAEAYAPKDALCLDISYEHECFAGETLILQAENGHVCGIKPDGTVSFRAYFYKGESV